MKAPGRIFTVLVWTALLAVLFFVLRDEMDTEELKKNRYWLAKTSSGDQYPIVFGGDSRVFRGLSPAVFSSNFNDIPAYNYAYWANGYGKDYLEGLYARLDSSAAFRMIVLGVSPHSLTKKTARSLHYQYELKRAKGNVRRLMAASRLEEFFAPYRVLELFDRALGRSAPHNIRIIYHDDGWVETWWLRPDTTRAERSYSTLFKDDPVDEEVVSAFLSCVSGWTKEGIHVVGYRPPASFAIRAFEEGMGEFSEAELVARFEEAGGIWIDVAPGDYLTYDGSHLEHESARRLSGDLARAISERLGKGSY